MLLVKGLRHNLVGTRQLCYKGNQVIFNTTRCLVINYLDKLVKLVGKGINNTYMIELDSKVRLDASCFIILNKNSWIWHKRHVHASMDLIGKLSRKDLLIGLLKLNYIKDRNVMHTKRENKWNHHLNLKRLFLLLNLLIYCTWF